MADKKITALTASTALSTDDLFHVVDSPASSPSNKKITVTNVFNKIPTYIGMNSVQALTNGTGQTVNVTDAITTMDSSSGNITGTLGSGATGQIKVLVNISGSNSSVITLTTTLGSLSTITFDAAGETATCMWTGSAWTVLATSTSAANIATILQ
jgi:hypothetical protein